MKFKFLGVFKRVLNWFKSNRKPLKYRPHFYSKNAWSYVSRGKPTAAEVMMWRLCR